ncbi:hypothetical protein GJ496_006669 [Pomphorhynchus laevis]|nr:hypothetical protein GJ496_006669 [Pomphorhynchus laevis]
MLEARSIQQCLSHSREIHNKSWQGTFCKLMKSGKTVQAMRVLDPNYQSERVLKLSEKINGKTVRDILREKHPQAAGIVNGVIVNSPYQTDLPFYTECFDAERIIYESRSTSGSAGPSEVDSLQWLSLLTEFGEDSRQSAESIAVVARKISMINYPATA